MNLLRFILLLALLVPTLTGTGKAQVYFSTQVDWEHDFEYLGGVVAFDSSQQLLLAGGNLRLEPVSSSFFVASMTSQGEVVSKASFQPVSDAFGNTSNLLELNEKYSLIQGNAEVVGNTGVLNYQLFFIKIENSTGDTVWVKEIGKNDLQEGGHKLISTSDGSFALSGYSFPVDNSTRPKAFLMKIDSMGNQVFKKEYTTDVSKSHHAYSLAQAADGGYLLLAYRSYNGPYPGGFGNVNKIDWVTIKTDSQGNQQWVKTYEPWEWKQNLFYGRDIQPLPDGTFLVAAGKGYALFEPNNTYSGKYFFARINSLGEFVDSVTLPGWHEFPGITRLKPSGDGNFWAIGAEKDSNLTAQTGLIIKITPNLQVLWKREYRVSPPESLAHEIFYEGTMMPDKGFVLCGGAFGPLEDSTNANGWVIRVDSLGCLEPGCDTVFTAVHGPLQEGDTGLLLSPNPTGGEIRLALADPEAVLLGVRVLDLQGRVLEDVQFRREAGWRECVLNLAGQPAGVYIVQARTSKGWVVRKVVKN